MNKKDWIMNLNTLEINPEYYDGQIKKIIDIMKLKYQQYIKTKIFFPIDIGRLIIEYGKDCAGNIGTFIVVPRQDQGCVGHYFRIFRYDI